MKGAAAALAGLLCASGLASSLACSRTRKVRPSEQRPEETPEGRGTSAGIPPKPGRPRIPAAPQGLLRPGVVAELQRALDGRGLLREHREGELDGPTSAAIRRFQREKGLAATGFPDRETLKDLGIDPERAYVDERDRRREEGKRDDGRRPEGR